MGSFSYTCAISGLPIGGGDPIRYFLLTENPYTDTRPCEMGGLWFVRTLPLKGIYDDYGGVDNLETGTVADTWLEGLRKDMVERGWGDNKYHQHPLTRENLSLDMIQEGVKERRLYVRREDDLTFDADLPVKRTVPKGVPTRKRVTKLLTASGLDPCKTYMSTRQYGVIRIRPDYAAKGSREILQGMEACLKDTYATMISAENEFQNELWVRPKPGTEKYRSFRREPKEKPLCIDHAMVREDVWQALLGIKVEYWGKNIQLLTIEDYQQGFEQLFKKLVGSCPGSYFIQDIPRTIGVGANVKMLLAKGELDAATIRTIAEFALINDVLASIRHMWYPSYSNGPQFGEWERHPEVFARFEAIAKANISKED